MSFSQGVMVCHAFGNVHTSRALLNGTASIAWAGSATPRFGATGAWGHNTCCSEQVTAIVDGWEATATKSLNIQTPMLMDVSVAFLSLSLGRMKMWSTLQWSPGLLACCDDHVTVRCAHAQVMYRYDAHAQWVFAWRDRWQASMQPCTHCLAPQLHLPYRR